MPDTLQIRPLTGPVDADVAVPGSKSYTNRALLIAALAKGESCLSGVLFSDDTHHMAEGLKTLGIAVQADEANATFTVTGTGGRVPAREAHLFVDNSGTTARFLTAYLSLGRGVYTLDGVPRMRQRPIQDLLDGLRSLGVEARSLQGNGCPPVLVEASGLKGGRAFMPGDKSSQYFTALLLVAPYAENDVEIRVRGALVSKPYIDITLDIMHDFGVEVLNDGYNTFFVRAQQRYRPRSYRIEPDASNASYFFAAAALTGGRIKVRGLTGESAQGDVGFVDILERMGCRVQKAPDGIEVQGPQKLAGIEIDMNSMSDIVQTLCAIAPFASDPVTVRNVAHMRIKETDRIAALAAELRKLGVQVDTRHDGLTVHPTDQIHPAELETYADHRMAMGLALVGLVCPGIAIRNPKCVNKTFPSYFEVLETLRQSRYNETRTT
jgi:3-phosphoshikimate 1-carboxyvinyltransferase